MMIDHGIRPIAYSPISRPGRGGSKLPDGSNLVPLDWHDLRKNPKIMAIAKAHGKSEVQVMLNWGIMKGHVVIPGAHSLDPKHVQYLNENIKIFDFRLTEEEMKVMASLDFGNRMFSQHDGFTSFKGYDVFA